MDVFSSRIIILIYILDISTFYYIYYITIYFMNYNSNNVIHILLLLLIIIVINIIYVLLVYIYCFNSNRYNSNKNSNLSLLSIFIMYGSWYIINKSKVIIICKHIIVNYLHFYKVTNNISNRFSNNVFIKIVKRHLFLILLNPIIVLGLMNQKNW